MLDNEKFPANAEEDEVNLLDLVAVIVKRKWIILTLAGAALVFSVLYCFMLPNIYSATARFLPPTRQIGPLSGLSILMGVRLANLAGPQFGDGANLCLGVLKSRAVEDAVINRLDLSKAYNTETDEETRNALERNVRIQADNGMISVTVEDKDPKRAAAVANAFVEELDPKIRELKLFEEDTERIYLKKVLDMVGNELEKTKESLKLAQDLNGGPAAHLRSIAGLEQNARLKAELAGKEIQLESLKAGGNMASPQAKALKSEIAIIREKIKTDSAGTKAEDKKGLQELKIRQELFDLLKKQYELAGLSKDKDPSSITVLDEAVA
ncbi:MAG TPA: Wzz/FepE/Etk N-terminal domain-containing protein, partial [Geobacteraceae bacterium]|nr:Wzz/FepE/Etk N-terminal domain-containing protein [Geobacteraceae bacterium]